MPTVTFEPVLQLRQSAKLPVYCFEATAAQINDIARIERVGRSSDGALRGFQRPQIAKHIREIQDYLIDDNAILPNAIVLGFCKGVTLSRSGTLRIDVSNGPPGWVVDGQQRLTAALALTNRRVKLLVSAFVCRTKEELNRQFILINNTRPLPRQLIYELLPTVDGLPPRLSSRSSAALLTEALNFGEGSSLQGLIHQQTNPEGIIRDTILQRVIMSSLSDGALRSLADDRETLLEEGFNLVSEFFWAVRQTFKDAWDEQTPKTSRLVHGVGIVAMGYVMEAIHTATGAVTREQFARGLRPLIGRTAWTSGSWDFGTHKRPWNELQNTASDYRLLTAHLVRLVRVSRLQKVAG